MESPVELLKDKISDEGFEYALLHYSNWPEIKDKNFHMLREAYERAQLVLEDYIESSLS